MPQHIFRANDIRGKAESELTDPIVKSIAWALAELFSSHDVRRIGVARDVRLSSPRIMKSIVNQLSHLNLTVIDCGVLPSPVAYFAGHTEDDLDGFVIITASHNPSEYNGIKVNIKGQSLNASQVQQLFQWANQAPEINTSEEYKLEQRFIIPKYIDFLSKKFEIASDLKVVIDPANATGAIVAPKLLSALGVAHEVIHGEIDGTFPNHHPDPTVAANMKDLAQTVLANDADLGIGFDGDSDRIGVVDDKGRFISGDILTAIFANDILSNNPGASIVIEVKSSQLLIDCIESAGGKVEMSAVGHGFIKQKMAETNALLAGELSGHMFFSDDYFGYDDAFYCMLRLLKLLSTYNKKLSEIIDAFPVYFNTPEIHLICCSDEEKFSLFESIKADLINYPDYSDLDGLRINFEKGWALVRPSNTQPVIVTRYEANSNEALAEIRKEIGAVIGRYFKGEIKELS